VGGGTGPAYGTRATTCTPAPIQMQMMLQSTDDLPLNFGFNGKVRFSFLLIYNACSFFFFLFFVQLFFLISALLNFVLIL